MIRGWTPFNRVNNSPKQEQKLLKKVKLFDVFDNYLHQINQQTAKKSLRPDTLRAYTSYIKNLKAFLIEKKQANYESILIHVLIDHEKVPIFFFLMIILNLEKYN
ncbi:hypothetical protein [Tenacibaculum dicentrarchi]|uniref:hypothetical protein n=1 Tax=Tenacibaculum dicentrarchi TaxID=669041 RepID=UPI0035130DEE